MGLMSSSSPWLEERPGFALWEAVTRLGRWELQSLIYSRIFKRFLQVVYRLARDQVTVNKEVLIPATLTKEEEAAPIRPKMNNNKAKRERVPDWSDY